MSLSSFKASTLARLIAIVFSVIFLTRVFVISAFSVPSDSMQPTLLRGDYVLVYTLGQHLSKCTRWVHTSLHSLLHITTDNDQSSVLQRYTPVAFRFAYDSCQIEPNTILVKRIVGLPGDTLTVTKADVEFGQQALRDSAEEELRHAHLAGRELPYTRGVRVPQRGQHVDLNPTSLTQWKQLIENEGNTIVVKNGIVYLNSNATPEYVLKNNYYYVLGDNSKDSYDSRYWGFVKDDDLIGRPWLVYWSRSLESSGVPASTRWDRIATVIH